MCASIVIPVSVLVVLLIGLVVLFCWPWRKDDIGGLDM